MLTSKTDTENRQIINYVKRVIKKCGFCLIYFLSHVIYLMIMI